MSSIAPPTHDTSAARANVPGSAALNRAQMMRTRRQGSLFEGQQVPPPLPSLGAVCAVDDYSSSPDQYISGSALSTSSASYPKTVGRTKRPFIPKRSRTMPNVEPVIVGANDACAGLYAPQLVVSPDALSVPSSALVSSPLWCLTSSTRSQKDGTRRRSSSTSTPCTSISVHFPTITAEGSKQDQEAEMISPITPDSATWRFAALKLTVAARRARMGNLMERNTSVSTLAYPPSPTAPIPPPKRPLPIPGYQTNHTTRRRSVSFDFGLNQTKIFVVGRRSRSSSLCSPPSPASSLSSSAGEYGDTDEKVKIVIVTGECTYESSEARCMDMDVQHQLRTLRRARALRREGRA